MMPILLDSFIFWTLIVTLVCSCFYIIRLYMKADEKQAMVNRGWDDMNNRAERIITRLEDIEYILLQKKNKTVNVKKTNTK